MKMMMRRELENHLTELARSYEDELPNASVVLLTLAAAVLEGEEGALAKHCAKFARAALKRIDARDTTQTDMMIH